LTIKSPAEERASAAVCGATAELKTQAFSGVRAALAASADHAGQAARHAGFHRDTTNR